MEQIACFRFYVMNDFKDALIFTVCIPVCFSLEKNETLNTFSGVIICLKNLKTECLQNESEVLMDSVDWLVMCR